MSTCNNILIPRGLFQSILITWLDKTTSALLGKDVGLYVPLYSSVRLSGMHTIFSRWKDRRARQHWPRKSTTWKFRSKSYISIYMCVYVDFCALDHVVWHVMLTATLWRPALACRSHGIADSSTSWGRGLDILD